jgi:hypothetical protein
VSIQWGLRNNQSTHVYFDVLKNINEDGIDVPRENEKLAVSSLDFLKRFKNT